MNRQQKFREAALTALEYHRVRRRNNRRLSLELEWLDRVVDIKNQQNKLFEFGLIFSLFLYMIYFNWILIE